MKQIQAIIVFLAMVMLASSAIADADADNFRQKNVDYIVNRIKTSLNESLLKREWGKNYERVLINIEDLEKTIRTGGRAKSNPVEAYRERLGKMLVERRAIFDSLNRAQIKLDKNRKTKSKQLILDVGMEFINQIRPKVKATDPFAIALSKNMKTIKREFEELRTVEDAIRLIDSYKDSIKPAIRDMRDRFYALDPLLKSYNSATPTRVIDGRYAGRLRGAGAGGSIRFTISTGAISGSLSGSYKGDAISGSFSGTVKENGRVSANIRGTLQDSTGVTGSWKFTGTMRGNVSPTGGGGSWSADGGGEIPKGSWKVSKQ